MKSARLFLTSTLTAAVLSATGCATRPDTHPLIEEARSEFQVLANQPEVRQHAPREFERAQTALNVAEAEWREDGASDELEHLVYLSKRRSAIANEQAKISLADDELQMVKRDRQQLIVEARTREAELARLLARERLLEAEQSREAAALSALEAERRAQELEQTRTETEMLRAEKQAREAELAEARQRAQQLELQVSELETKQTDRGLVLTLSDILFDLNSDQLKPGAERTISKISDFLNDYPDRMLVIEGFTDSTGSQSYNEDLSERRAESVRTALIDRGVDPSRVSTRGYGEDFPVASNDTNAGRLQNRRVEIVVSDSSEMPEERRR